MFLRLLFFLDPHRGFWIGLNRVNSSSEEFEWVDGTALPSGEEWVEFAWNTDEMNVGETIEDCVIMGHPCCEASTYRWFSVDCNQTDFSGRGLPSYICQRNESKFLGSLIIVSSNITACSYFKLLLNVLF